jgi:hypothetical protein
MFSWLWKALIPGGTIEIDNDGEGEMAPFTWFRGMAGDFTVINTEDLPDAIAAEYENAAADQEMAVDEHHRWVLDHDGIREIIAIALETDDEDLALLTVIANTTWNGREEDLEDGDPFL